MVAATLSGLLDVMARALEGGQGLSNPLLSSDVPCTASSLAALASAASGSLAPGVRLPAAQLQLTREHTDSLWAAETQTLVGVFGRVLFCVAGK